MTFLFSLEDNMMAEIYRQFPIEILQYACVSVRDNSESIFTSAIIPNTMQIQIILKRVINKRGWFFDKITGNKTKHMNV